MNIPDTTPLPSLSTLLGKHAHRLQGITAWEQIPLLGKTNIERLIQFARETTLTEMAEGAGGDELRARQSGVAFLSNALVGADDKPLLPRLRVESFRKGDAVVLYLGDAVGSIAPAPWVAATITAVDKAFRTDWNDGSANGGYFWRWEATAAAPVFPSQCAVRFSTSEPRALPAEAFRYLRAASAADPDFRAIFCANAERAWEPLWCIERGVVSSGRVAMAERLGEAVYGLKPTPSTG